MTAPEERWPHPSFPVTSLRLPPPLTGDSRLLRTSLTLPARPPAQTMFPVKVKVEKSGEDPEVGGPWGDQDMRCGAPDKEHRDDFSLQPL